MIFKKKDYNAKNNMGSMVYEEYTVFLIEIPLGAYSLKS